MTLLDHPPTPPRLVCGIKRVGEWSLLHEPLGCVLDMNHPGRVHQDRMGRTWELLIEYTPRAHHVDVVGRLVALIEGELAILERINLMDGHELRAICPQLVAAERGRVISTLAAMGLVEAEPDEDEPGRCGNCRRPFDPSDVRWDGLARHRDTEFCRGCVDTCHNTEIAGHRCRICGTVAA